MGFPDSSRNLTRDDALMWLNDRRGRNVHVSVRVEMGFPATVLEAHGSLRYWQEDAPTKTWSGPSGEPRSDLEGWYIVGEHSRFDLTDLDHAVFSTHEDGPLRVNLTRGGDVWLQIAELVDESESES